jgi:serine/threonine-protein kinase RsbW
VNQPISETEPVGIVELRVPCRPEWVALARMSSAAVASRMHFSIDDIEDVKLAVAEACTNAILHAEGSTAMEIRCETLTEGLKITVRDFGRGTVPERIVPRDLDDARVGGLGVFLIRSLMDDVEYDVHTENGTSLTMFKRRPI